MKGKVCGDFCEFTLDKGHFITGDYKMYLPEMIVKDKEIQKLKAEYKELCGKNAPPFVIGEDYDIDSYKEKLREMVKNLK